MTVVFLADIEVYTPPSETYLPMREDDMAVDPPETSTSPSPFRRPVFDRTGVTGWVMVELRAGKALVRAEGITVTPVGAQTIGDVTKTTVVDRALAGKIKDYFGLTNKQRNAAVGKMFGEVIYILMLVKPAVKDGKRTLILGGPFHEVVEP